MNPFFLVGIVILVFVVALLTGFLIGWEVAHRKMLKQMQELRSEAVLSTAAQVAQKLRVVEPENSKPVPGVVQGQPQVSRPVSNGPTTAGPAQSVRAPRPFEQKGVHAPPPSHAVKPSNHRGDGDSAQ